MSNLNNGIRITEKMDGFNAIKEETLDPYENLDDFFVNHPAAVNKPYVYNPNEPKCSTELELDELLREEEALRVKKEEPDDVERFIPPSLRDDAPLAGILHPSLDRIDPRAFFKDFAPNKTLRFSRIFEANIKPSARAEIWWPSKSFVRKLKDKKEEVTTTDAAGRPESKKIKLEILDEVDYSKVREDQEASFARPIKDEGDRSKNEGDGKTVQSWRNGPAKIWYDMMDVPSTSTGVNYGFRAKKFAIPFSRATNPTDSTEPQSVITYEKGCGTNDDGLEPYQVIEWEKEVILDGDDVRQKLVDELTSEKMPSCGWIPTQYTRSYEHFVYAANNGAFEKIFEANAQTPLNLIQSGLEAHLPTQSHSIFPSAPSDMDIHPWEDNVIWDADEMPERLVFPEPIDFLVDFMDDPLIYGMPEDREEDRSDRKDNQFTKKSKMILGQVQQRQKQEEEEQMESSMAQFTDNDPFNLSNDQYYMPKGTAKTLSSNSLLIQHSTPAQNIHRTFFPTHPSDYNLRLWHRPTIDHKVLRLYFPMNRFSPILTTTRHQQMVREIREKVKQSEGGGDIFFMRDVADLSGRDGELVCVEYSEEHPVVLSQPGMAGKLKNYYKRKQGNDTEPMFDLGEMAFSHQVPFLGQLQPGQALQSIENNMYRSPLFRHQPKYNDYLLIRWRNGFYIRPFPALFVAGQQCPLYEVPSPNSKRANVFSRDFLFAYIYRLFWASEHSPRRLRMEDIKLAFPNCTESNVRKRLKMCSKFTRNAQDSYWELKPEFRLPTKEEVLAMVTPEMCCVQYSMLAAEQRLKDAGYGEKYFFTPDNDEASDDEVTIEDEIKCAPWNTSRAFLASQRDKCLLDNTGIADPTGCGQGFSYVRVSQKPHKDDAPPVPKKLVTGTNADLRKLPLKEAKEICRDYGVKEEEINALTRWEIIDVIRTLSTQAAKATKEGEAASGMARFARGNTRFSSADMQEKYRKHCQRIFDLQNMTLANREDLSTDEDSSDVDSDDEEFATRLESMLESNKNKKSISMSEQARIEFESEEQERKDLKRMIHGDTVTKSEEKKEVTAEEKKNASKFCEDVAMSASKISGITANQKLVIYRTKKASDGTTYTRPEVVTRPQLIEAYTRIRMTRDATFIQVYAQMDEQYKEEKRKKKRRLQDQLRRMKKNEEKQATKPPKPGSAEKKPKPFNPNLAKMKCSACQGSGHMRTNKNCPLYGKDITPMKSEDESIEPPTPSHFEEASHDMAIKLTRQSLIELNEQFEAATKQTQQKRGRKSNAAIAAAAKEQISAAEKIQAMFSRSTAPSIDDDDDDRGSIKSQNAGQVRGSRHTSVAKRRQSTLPEEDYLHGPAKTSHRMRADPRVTFSTMLTEIFNELKMLPGAGDHLQEVNRKAVPDYHGIVRNPIWLNKIKNKINDYEYPTRQSMLQDLKTMAENAHMYNGPYHGITECAHRILNLAGQRMRENEVELIKLEKQINPLLDSNDIVGFNHVLALIVESCKRIPNSVPFHAPVNIKKIPNYVIIKNPMDLGTIGQKVQNKFYEKISQFTADIDLMLSNCRQFNGPNHLYTLKCEEISQVAYSIIKQEEGTLNELESNMTRKAMKTDQGNDMADMEKSNGDGRNEEQEEMEDANEEFDESNDVELEGMDDEESESNWDETMNMERAGQVMIDLEMSDSDEEERLEDMRRSNNEEDNRLDSF